jgi:hypothetical protein
MRNLLRVASVLFVAAVRNRLDTGTWSSGASISARTIGVSVAWGTMHNTRPSSSWRANPLRGRVLRQRDRAASVSGQSSRHFNGTIQASRRPLTRQDGW